MKVLITEAAWSDLRDIALWIQADNPRRAVSFVDEIISKCDDIAFAPLAAPLLPHRPESGIRRKIFGNYLVFYRVEDRLVSVLHILNSTQDVDRILFSDND